MAKNNEGEAQQSGFFGRIFGSKGKSPVKAKMGEQNKFVYDEKLKRWVIPGEKVEESTFAAAPPPLSRGASATSMSDSEGPDGHRRSGSTDSTKRGGAAARYANPGLLATSRTGSDQSMSTASIIPFPAKPPLAPSAKPSVFVPGGKSEGTAASTGPRFFVPGGSSTAQGASSRFAGFSSKARQAQTAGEEATAEQPPPDEAVLSPSKRARMSDPGQQGPGESMESEVTLAKGVAELESSQPSEATFAHGIPPTSTVGTSGAADESVGENTFAETSGASDGAVTSPGPREQGEWGLRGGAAADSEDPKGGAASGSGPADQPGGDFGLGEGAYTQQLDQAQDYFGADAAAATQMMGDVSAPEGAYLGSEAYSGTEAYSGAEAYTGASAEGGTVQATWEEVQQWADYYRQEGYSEEDVQAWIASNYPQFGQQQPSSQDIPALAEGSAEAAAMEGVVQEQLPSNARQPSTAAGNARAAEAGASRGDGQSGEQLHGSFQEPAVTAEGTQPETAFQERRRLQSEAPSDMADCGSSIGHLDDLASVGTMSQGPSQARFGRLASESSASGKLSGPLPWDVLDDRSDEENSTAGTPRFELAYANGEAENAARPSLAGAAFAEATEQAGTKLTGWVTGLVRSGVQSHLMAHSRFPRAPLDNRNAPSSPSVSVRSGNTSTRAQQGTPTSVKSVPVEGQHGDGGSLPPSAKAARYGRGAFDNESVLSEAILEEEPDQDDHGFKPDQENRGFEPDQENCHYEPDQERDSFEPDQENRGRHQENHSFQEKTHSSRYGALPEAADVLQHGAGPQEGADSAVDAWQNDAGGNNHAADQDGWDFDASALDDLPTSGQQQQHGDFTDKQPHSAVEDAAALQDIAAPVEGKQAGEDISRLPRTWEGDLPQPGVDSAGFGLDQSDAVHTTGSAVDIPYQAGTNGPSSLMGESPPAGWEGGSELAFPLDDVPKDAQPSRHASALDLPEAAALTPLRVPPLTPLRTVSGPVASGSAAAAAVKEAFAHGDEAVQLAALQERLQEVIALHQHASDECETLRDQNGALELELADLKTQQDADVAEARQAQDALAAKAQLEEQLEELWQELEQLRAKNDALKADNATLLAEREADGDAAVTHSNGDLKPRGAAADVSAPAAAVELEAARRRVAELEALLEQGSGEERIAELEAQIEDLMAEAETQAEESLAKDEEIDGLEAQLAAAKQALAAAQQGTSQELEQLRKEAAAANAEVISLGDALDTLGQETTRLNQSLAAKDAELEGLHSDLAGKAADAQLLADLQSQLAARETEIARLLGELTSKEEELARISKEAPAKEATEKKLRAALKHAKEAAARDHSELTAQLEAAQQAASDAQAQAERLTAQLSELQESKAAAEQQHAHIEAEIKTLKENAALDFERIGLLSEENAGLQEKVEELQAAGGSGASPDSAAELAQLRDEVAAAVARSEEAEARAKTLAQEKESFGKRGAKLQAKLNRLQAEFQEKQAQLTKDLEDARERAAAAEKQAAEAEAERATLAQAVEQEETRALQESDALKSEASTLAAQVAKLQEAVAAESQRREEAEQQLAAAAQEAAEVGATKHALSEELAAEKNKVAELEEEAAALFDRVSAAEDEAGAADARAHSLAQKLEAAQASLQATEQGGSSGGAVLQEELEQVKAEAAEQEKEFGELLACLGQESAKVAALQELLLQRGFDPSGVLAQVEADYGFNDEGDGEDDAGGEEGEKQAGGELQDRGVDAEVRGSEGQEGPGRAAHAPADRDWPGFSADAPAVEPEPVQEPPASSAQHAQHAHQSSIEGLPEGELLSPEKGLPSLREDVKSEITAGINFGGVQQTYVGAAGQDFNFDGWDADADGDWGFN
ncbi:g4252 [Coccomyxa elongata]